MTMGEMKSWSLDWIIENRTIPVEVTDSLQELADTHQYSADEMHQHKKEIVKELHLVGKGYIAKFLFPMAWRITKDGFML
jgi:hypothetical protein